MQILFEHPWFLVINKPADLLTQAVDGIESVQTRLIDHLRSQHPTGPTPFIGVPHRLDRVTTGVMVFARNQRALKRLCEQFAARTVRKKYHALVSCSQPTSDQTNLSHLSTHPSTESGQLQNHQNIENEFCGTDSTSLHRLPLTQTMRWEDWIRKIPDMAQGEICNETDEGARKAILECTPLAHGKLSPPIRFDSKSTSVDISGEPLVAEHSYRASASLVELELETGRMHQIRIQCSSRGYPIIGDDLYGSKLEWLTGDYRQAPIALHARSISFRHPQTAELLTFEAPYPESWKRWIPDNHIPAVGPQ